MFTDSGTGDQAEAVFYTVPALPSPGRYSLRCDFNSTGHTVATRFQIRLGSSLVVDNIVQPGHTDALNILELLCLNADELSYSVAADETYGTQSYTWQVEFRLCRMPEDLL